MKTSQDCQFSIHAHASECKSWEPGVDTRVIDTIDMHSPILGEMLTHSIRDARQLGLEPILVLLRSDFRTLLDYWPQFYLLDPVLEMAEINAWSRLWSWLRHLFMVKKRTLSPPLIQFSGEELDRIREQMLREQVIPVDGIWVHVRILDNELDESTNDNPN